MTASIEARARRLLWLYPSWVRAERGEEALSLVLDQVPVGATQLPLRSRVDLVRAGLHARRRWTPPLRVWSAVLGADPRNQRGLVPDEWRPWLVHWLQRPRWRAQFAAVWFACCLMAVLFLAPIVLASAIASSIGGLWIVPIWFTGMQYHRAPRWRSIVLLRNGLVPDGLRPFPPGTTLIQATLPAVSDRPVRPALFASAAGSLGLLVVTVIVLVVRVAPVPSAWATVAFGAASFSCSVVLAVLMVRPALARARGASRMPPPRVGPGVYVGLHFEWQKRARRRVRWFLVPSAAVMLWILACAGVVGIVVTAIAAIASGSLLAVVVRSEGRVGRPLTLWELWPNLGPQPYLVVREDQLEAVERPSA